MSLAPKIAIACQGGGSHAAFAAGVLSALLAPEFRDRYQLIALSGTSGGAICAALVWSGLIRGGADEARRRLIDFWRDLEVNDILDAVANFWAVSSARLPVSAEVSPYLYSPIAEPRLRGLLTRHLDLASLPSEPHRRASPKLLIGATDIIHGLGVAFEGESLTYDELIASAAVPPLFRAVQAHGTLFWDGLFSRNPPVREFTDLPEPPDEIWVVQINPQQRKREPRAMPEIIDRRNELSANLALSQELFFITKINELLAQHPSLRERYQPINIRVVELEDDLDYPSKLDRSSPMIERLLRMGQERAPWFFEGGSLWPR
ncbi:patatin-like phospholipase family protein (plasmid) [Rhizobium sp. CC1099]|uniref:patatin-like phospholipase family protein n=1 Tax=Rhizobium sp. CC1099 TaxID=3039160 RepID=UPI0024B23003|nr:patatin-like phospholipase family protein [Rhizobium sp. CC1099]WFU92041.1 patatin-like phospholipase family protein [Rhizobium sp. CC1099]